MTPAVARLFVDLAEQLAGLEKLCDYKDKVARLAEHALAIAMNNHVPEVALERSRAQMVQ